MADTNNQYFYGNTTQVSGIKIERQQHIEIHQHFISPLDRKKLHKELMAFQKSDPELFNAIRGIAVEMSGDVMFVKFDDTKFQSFYGIKNIVFKFYQEKECLRLALSQEQSKVHSLERELAVEKNRVALYEQEIQDLKSTQKISLFSKLFGR